MTIHNIWRTFSSVLFYLFSNNIKAEVLNERETSDTKICLQALLNQVGKKETKARNPTFDLYLI